MVQRKKTRANKQITQLPNVCQVIETSKTCLWSFFSYDREVNIAELVKEASKNVILEFGYPLSQGPKTDT